MNYKKATCCDAGVHNIEWHEPDSYTDNPAWLLRGGWHGHLTKGVFVSC